MQFEKNGITLTVSEDSLRQLVLQRLTDPPPVPIEFDSLPDPAPRIGELWSAQGGIYAGVMRGRDGASDYYLIVGPEYETDIDWNAGDKWAAGLKVHGLADFSLPFRKEQ